VTHSNLSGPEHQKVRLPTIEALVIAVRHGLAVRQLPVQMRQRAGGTPSHGFLKSARLLARAFLALGIALTRPRSSVRNREGGGE